MWANCVYTYSISCIGTEQQRVLCRRVSLCVCSNEWVSVWSFHLLADGVVQTKTYTKTRLVHHSPKHAHFVPPLSKCRVFRCLQPQRMTNKDAVIGSSRLTEVYYYVENLFDLEKLYQTIRFLMRLQNNIVLGIVKYCYAIQLWLPASLRRYVNTKHMLVLMWYFGIRMVHTAVHSTHFMLWTVWCVCSA